MSEPEIIVVKDKRQTKPKDDRTLEQRIVDARDKFMSEKSRDVERLITKSLEENYESLILNLANLERDLWNNSGWKFHHYNRSEFTAVFHARAKAHAMTLLDSIDFSTVELTQGQVNAIKAAYNSEMKRHVEKAARELARRDSLRIAAKVLGVELNDPSEVLDDEEELD